MNRAIELLRDPSARVAEITRAVGFSTSSYFIKFFKKHTGLTPQDYRGRVLS